MSPFQSGVTTLITFGTLVSHVVFVVASFLIVLEKGFRDRVYSFFYKYILHFLFGLSLSAVVGSLAYSQVIGFPPCELCWVQRIFIYPQALLTFIALLKKDKGIVDYLLPFSVIGGAVALYQSFIHWGFSVVSLGGCTALLGGECAKVYVHSFGYITIPFMSFTIFAYAIVAVLLYYKARKIHS